MYSTYNLNKQGDNIQPWHTPFPIWNQSVVPCQVLTVASWHAYRFLKRSSKFTIFLKISLQALSCRSCRSLVWMTILAHYKQHYLSLFFFSATDLFPEVCFIFFFFSFSNVIFLICSVPFTEELPVSLDYNYLYICFLFEFVSYQKIWRGKFKYPQIPKTSLLPWASISLG